MAENASGSRTALIGLGGVGKSQLAIEYAYRIREQPEIWVFWIHACSAARFEQSIQDIADCAKIYGRQNLKANIFQLVHGWLPLFGLWMRSLPLLSVRQMIFCKHNQHYDLDFSRRLCEVDRDERQG